jgi:hypothetical protein
MNYGARGSENSVIPRNASIWRGRLFTGFGRHCPSPQDRIIATLAGKPNDPQMDGVSVGAAEDVRETGEAYLYRKTDEASAGAIPYSCNGSFIWPWPTRR